MGLEFQYEIHSPLSHDEEETAQPYCVRCSDEPVWGLGLNFGFS